MKTFLQKPYFDDYDENKKFYKVLYRPSKAVQARELNTMQSIIQNQIKRFGDNVFTNGAKIYNGQLTIHNDIHYVRLSRLESTDYTAFHSLVGHKVQAGGDTGTIAEVLAVADAEVRDGVEESDTIMVRFISSDQETNEQTFKEGQALSVIDAVSGDILYNFHPTVLTPESQDTLPAVGYGSVASITDGIYYVYGYFVLVNKQTIILEKYSPKSTYRIGLDIVESTITPEDDDSLNDNAIGSTNYAAPGAHRYMIDLKLIKVKKAITIDEDSFIELGETDKGSIVKIVETTDYSKLVTEDVLAGRTFDESGDYTVRPFRYALYEHRSNQCGVFGVGKNYLIGDIVSLETVEQNADGQDVKATRFFVATASGVSGNKSPLEGNDGNLTWKEITNAMEGDYLNGGLNSFEGYISKVTITNSGSGYTTPPSLTVLGSQNRDAILTPVLTDGEVTGVEIKDAGEGYTKESSIDVIVSSPTVGTEGVKAEIVAEASYGDDDKFVMRLDSGKAYVKGYCVEKVGSVDVVIDKARVDLYDDENHVVIPHSSDSSENNEAYFTIDDCNYVKVQVVKGNPDALSTDKRLQLFALPWIEVSSSIKSEYSADDTELGTCNYRSLEFAEYESPLASRGGDAKAVSIYNLYISDLSIRDFPTKVKSLRSVDGSFIANVIPQKNAYAQGSITKNAGDARVTGENTLFTDSKEQASSKYIAVAFDNDPSTYVARCESDTSITIVGVSGMTYDEFNNGFVANQVFTKPEKYYKVTALIHNVQSVSNVFQLPKRCVKDIDYQSGIGFTEYETLTCDSAEYKNGITKATFVLETNSVTTTTGFGSERINDYVVYNDTDMLNMVDGATDSVVVNGNAVTLQIKGNHANETIKCLCWVKKSIKSVSDIGKKELLEATDTGVLVDGALTLSKTDGYELISVVDANGNDVTSKFVFEDGQTGAFYGFASIHRKKNLSISGTVTVTYRYFAHSGATLYTKDSYADCGLNLMTELPSFNGVSLRDCIDFRPDLSSGTTSLVGGTGINLSYSYYYGRKDRICLSPTGVFYDLRGIPSDDPKFPEPDETSMVLYNVTLLPYTEKVDGNNIIIEMVDNKRYTMRDIGRLEHRIDKLEMMTALSLLEQQTASMLIVDENGLDRFSNGFVVDNFTTGLLGNREDDAYNCAIDTVNGQCRPSFITNSLQLIELDGTDSSRNKANYAISGKIITLPRKEDVILINQPLASRTENINPFAVATFYGRLECNPATDDWFETTYIADDVKSVEGSYSNFKALEGTYWNDWQTNWTGEPREVSSSSMTIGSSRNSWNDDWGSFTQNDTIQTTTTFAQEIGQSRTGNRVAVTERIDYEEVGDRIVSTSAIKNMRSRYLALSANGLKPYTKFFPFFDDEDISYWCTPCSVLEYTPVQGEFTDKEVANLTDANEVKYRSFELTQGAFWVDETEKTCLDRGDVITTTIGGSTYSAVVMGVRTTNDSEGSDTTQRLYITNIKKDGVPVPAGEVAFKSGNVVTGTISNARGRVLADVAQKHHGDDIVTDGAGEAFFVFWIPNSSKIDFTKLTDTNAVGAFDFLCGDRVAALSDEEHGNNVLAQTTYSAVGILNTRQKSINAVRNAQVVGSTVTDNKTVTNTWSNTDITVQSTEHNLDPLAETILISAEGGCFLSKVDIYFASKDESLPVRLQIRTVENGYPTNKVLAFGDVLKSPSDVNVSTVNASYVNDAGITVSYPTYDTPTTFEFESPVYVENNTEYAIVLLSNSTKYRVWTAKVGDVSPEGTVISKQPYNGVLFLSQNGTAWTADQNQDLMFKVYRCEFDTSKTANVKFINPAIPQRWMGNDPFFHSGEDSKVTVFAPCHGFSNGHIVRFTHSDVNAIDEKSTGEETFINGIALSVLTDKRGFKVSNVTLNSFDIEIDNVSGVMDEGYFGGSGFYMSSIINYDIIQPTINYQTFPDTTIGVDIQTMPGYTVGGDNVGISTLSGIAINDNTSFATPMAVYDAINVANVKNSWSNNGESLLLRMRLSSTNSALSPMIDTERVSAVLVNNQINDATNVEDIQSKYITKEVVLAEQSNMLKILFAYNMPIGSNIRVYVKAYSAFGSDAETAEWSEVKPNGTLLSSDIGSNVFKDASYDFYADSYFDRFIVMVAYTSNNSCAVPKITQFRTIACE